MKHENFKKALEVKLQNVTESILDVRRTKLAQDVWEAKEGKYRLKADVKNKILKQLEEIPDTQKDRIWLIGSITGFYYNDRTDIDIHLLPSQLSDKEYETAKKQIEKLGDKVNDHLIQYYIHKQGEEPYADGIYDVKTNKWLKWKDIDLPDLESYYKEFRNVVDPIDINKAELYRDLVDIEYLSSISKDITDDTRNKIEQEVEAKIQEINDITNDLIDQYEKIKDRRSQALHKDFEDGLENDYSGTIKRYRSAQLLPDAVIAKLLEKYHYKSFLRALKKNKDVHGEIEDKSDTKNLANIFKQDGKDL